MTQPFTIFYLSDLVETEPTEAEAVISVEGDDVVRLMTVHQTKGLEFPIVIIPELGTGDPPTIRLFCMTKAWG